MAGPWPSSAPYQPQGAPNLNSGQNPAAVQALQNVVIALNAMTAAIAAQTVVIGNILTPQRGGAVFGGELLSANFNSAADQAITITSPTANWVIQAILVTNPSISLTTAVGGFYTSAAKAGFPIVAAGQAYSALTLNTVNTAGSALLLTAVTTAYINVATIYLSLTTPQGAAATADVRVYIRPLY